MSISSTLNARILRTNVISAAFFSSYMYVKKAAETAFVQKIRTYNVDEIDGRHYNQEGDTLFVSFFKVPS